LGKSKNNASKDQTLRWRFDVNTFRLLGRELITDRITAVYELVKNCYDANATKVDIIFENVKEGAGKDSRIIISDNGIGMSFSDIRDKWMVVGTASKRRELYTPKPFNRRYVGEKGIGRFAVDKLGQKVEIATKQKNTTQSLIVDINWDTYDQFSKSTQLTLFTDIENSYHYIDSDKEKQGTTLTISALEETWTDLDIKRLERELEKIVSPFFPLDPPFEITIQCDEYPEFANKPIKAERIKYSSHEFVLDFDEKEGKQETLTFNKATGKIEVQKIDFKSFGPIKFHIYYFNEQAKKRYNQAYKNDDYRVDGVKIYRDGLITTPFAEFEGQRDKKRDILGIEKRRWSSAFDKIGVREVIGILEITKQNNPKIIDATNRQDFVDNKQYRDLKDFIFDQLNSIGDLKKSGRDLVKDESDIALKNANDGIKEFTTVIADLEKKNPTLKPTLELLKKQAKEIDKSLKKGIQQQQKERQEHIRKENIYLSLMSLQDYAVHISHAVRTSLGKVKRMAEFFKDKFPEARYNDLFKEYAISIFDEMNNLNRVIDFMLSYAGSNIDMQDFNVKDLLHNLLEKAYKPMFTSEGINLTIEVKDSFIVHTNKKFFEDILENLISNSVKALRHEKNKIIKCVGYIDGDNFVLYFSDNGEGILPGDEEKIFQIFYTTTADLGGGGVGLYIVKTRVESLQGTISVVKSEFSPKGATFKMLFPLKKND